MINQTYTEYRQEFNNSVGDRASFRGALEAASNQPTTGVVFSSAMSGLKTRMPWKSATKVLSDGKHEILYEELIEMFSKQQHGSTLTSEMIEEMTYQMTFEEEGEDD